MHYIYKITNTVNDKIYIGQTINIKVRWLQHKSKAKQKSNDQVITRAITKYGSEFFDFVIIATCRSQDDANATEMAIIAQYNSTDKDIGYNVRLGGNTSPMPEEIRERISLASMGKAGTNNGKKFDKEWVNKISKSLTNKENKIRRRFSDEIEMEICRLYVEEERSTYWLGQKFDCNRNMISTILGRNNIEIRKSNYTGHKNGRNIFVLEQESEICRMYREGNVSRSEISRRFKCGKTTIRDILIRNGLINH